ncbi:ATPase [Gilvimarinus agarilyticus]|uniref:N-acetylglucosamine kinase n=1 Tax=unclassified Gilvimarinus TaxID=2642066 RepID=UPI001C08FEA6|nr:MULTISPECIES: BadF/BadG/BcrA/BcrD ATPase family protein [unclassified Gilvimarinus]MBU2887556.1 ATPase [Gilvimarinus agarilyticus]MDO6572207.1 BadF/BadG/BcrA/BcrD ATPase family protein [Gilvimarinus sp. 2_MG-2023]MDO6746769.1 BadF/BadG/BcrA/BcrD ATPase family protein [Gilvimarinus sp. 1_MG-2023]
MANRPTINDLMYLGVDGGGTKCRAILVDQENRVIGEGNGGPANPYHGVPRALESIVNATDNALRSAGLKPEDKSRVVAGLGLAGVNVPSLYTIVKQWDHPYYAQYLTTDLHIACIAAHNQIDGAVIVSGTGSCGFAHVGNDTLTLGAHGFPLGDVGSGAWMGLECIKAVLLDSDDLGPKTAMTELVAEQLQARGIMIVERLNGAKSSDYAKMAPLVFAAAEQGDEIALSIVHEGAGYLTDVARKLWQLNPPRMAMLGGVSQRIVDWMDKDIAAKMSEALNQPEFGAVQFARTQFETQSRIAVE